MIETLRHAFKISLFDRPTARRLGFDTSATGDAVLLVAAIEAVIVLVGMLLGGSFDLIGLIQAAILAIAGWLILAAAIWLMATKLLKGGGEIEAMIRVSGFARLPLLLAVVDYFVTSDIFSLIGFVWHLALLVVAAGVVFGLQLKEAVAAVALGAALVMLVQVLFRAALFRF